MKLIIKLDKNEKDRPVIKIGFGKEKPIEVHLDEQDAASNTAWNTDKINTFLIKLSAATPADEEITVEADAEVDNKVYKHIVDIFETFANVYNNTTK